MYCWCIQLSVSRIFTGMRKIRSHFLRSRGGISRAGALLRYISRFCPPAFQGFLCLSFHGSATNVAAEASLARTVFILPAISLYGCAAFVIMRRFPCFLCFHCIVGLQLFSYAAFIVNSFILPTFHLNQSPHVQRAEKQRASENFRELQ